MTTSDSDGPRVNGYRLTALRSATDGIEIWDAKAISDPDSSVLVTMSTLPRDQTTAPSATALRQLRHPGLAHVVDVIDDPNAEPPVRAVVTADEPGVDLPGWLAEHPTATVTERVAILRMVAAALDHMHTSNEPVSYGSVRPENVLVRTDGSAVLVGSGAATLGDPASPYRAPEVLSAGSVSTSSADAFAFALTVVATLTGFTPSPDIGGVDVAQVRTALRRDPRTRARPAMIAALIETLTQPAEARPRRLREWLDRASSAGAPVTTPGGVAGVRDDRDRDEHERQPARRARWLIAAAGVLAAAGVVAVVIATRAAPHHPGSPPESSAALPAGSNDGPLVVQARWPLLPGCDSTTTVAHPGRKGAVGLFAGAGDPRTAILAADGAAWTEGHLTLTVTAPATTALQILNVKPHNAATALTAPEWVYKPGANPSCANQPTRYDRVFDADLDHLDRFHERDLATASNRVGPPLVILAGHTVAISVDARICNDNERFTIELFYTAAGSATAFHYVSPELAIDGTTDHPTSVYTRNGTRAGTPTQSATVAGASGCG